MAAKKNTAKSSTSKKTPAKGKSTAVRHTPIPQAEPTIVVAATVEVSHDMIARRAFEIWQSNGGCEFDNWTRAERELRAA